MESLTRRDFCRTAVAIGGSAALSACVEREPEAPRGTTSPEELPRRQHAWNDFLSTDDHGNTVMPRHHLLLHYDLAGGPDEDAADDVGRALRSLERAYEWSNRGLVFSVGYSHGYFDEVDADSPVPEPEPLASFEDPDLDDYDAVVHLASDNSAALLEAEQVLAGERDEANGVDVEGSFAALEPAERRTGFVGEGLPADNQDVDGVPDGDPVPEGSPLYMGFKSGFRENQATENSVTITDGTFAGGTTMQVSSMSIDLVQWYEQDSRFQREAKMFCPAHAEENRVEGVGDNLGDGAMTEDCRGEEAVRVHARTYGTVGHSEKMTRVREDDEPLMIRRDFNSTDGDEAGLHFVSVQESIQDFVDTREAMNAAEIASETAVGSRTNNGILQYIDMQSRANYVVPPRPNRALPMLP